MNNTATSKEEILKTSRKLIQERLDRRQHSLGCRGMRRVGRMHLQLL